MKPPLNIIYMGTPDFAVAPLKALHHSRHRVRLVVTPPDRLSGRGRKLTPCPVKTAALKMGCDIIQPESLKTEAFSNQIKAIHADLFVVVAFGYILTQQHLAIPPLGTVNLHASLLPKYRGPAPIQWAVINRETTTGVTAMLMDAGVDTGDILLCEETPIGSDETAGSLHDRLSLIGADMLIRVLDNYEFYYTHRQAQDDSKSGTAPMLKKKDGHIDWQKSAMDIEALIRGLDPWPGAYTFLNKKRLRIFKAKYLDETSSEPPGTVLKKFPGELPVATGNGILSLLEIQSASGKRMSVEDFLRGTKLPPGTVFS